MYKQRHKRNSTGKLCSTLGPDPGQVHGMASLWHHYSGRCVYNCVCCTLLKITVMQDNKLSNWNINTQCLCNSVLVLASYNNNGRLRANMTIGNIYIRFNGCRTMTNINGIIMDICLCFLFASASDTKLIITITVVNTTIPTDRSIDSTPAITLEVVHVHSVWQSMAANN